MKKYIKVHLLYTPFKAQKLSSDSTTFSYFIGNFRVSVFLYLKTPILLLKGRGV